MTKEAAREALPYLLREAFGYHWDDPMAQDFFVNREGGFWMRSDKGTYEVGTTRLTARSVRDIATLGAHMRGQSFDTLNPLLDCELPTGERVAAVLHPCTPGDCPLLAVRRGSEEMPTPESLSAQGVFDLMKNGKPSEAAEVWRVDAAKDLRDDGDIEGLMRHVAQNNMSAGFVGITGSGKTHDMKALLSAMRDTRRTLFVGDVNEVPKSIPLLNYAILLAGKHGAIPQGTLIAQTLRMAPELLCVMETRDGDAAWALYRALVSGHQVFTSWHADTAATAFGSLAAQMRENPNARSMQKDEIIATLRMMFHVVFSVARQADNSFRVTDVRFGDEIS